MPSTGYTVIRVPAILESRPAQIIESIFMRLFSRFSVAVSYPILTLLLVMGVFILIGFLALRGTRETSSELMLRLTDQATERMRQYVLSSLDAPTRIGDFNARQLTDGALKIDSAEDILKQVPFLASQLRAWTGVSAILICNSRDELVWVERVADGSLHLYEYFDSHDGYCVEWALDEEGRKLPEEISRFRYEPTKRPWHVAAMKSNGVGWTPLYLWANSLEEGIVGSGRCLRVESPDGSILGIIDVGFTVNDLSRQLEQIKVSPNGRVFIIDNKGMLIAANSVQDESAATTGVLARESADMEVKMAAVSLEGPGIFLDDEGFLHSTFTAPDGEIYQVDSERLKLEDGPDWTLVTMLPESDILAGVDLIRDRLVSSSLIVLLFSGIIAIMIARSITKPIISLKRSASEIASGGLDAHFSSRGGLEFTQLSDALDRMTRGLRERLEMRTALAVAMEVQQNLLPQTFPSTQQLDIAGSCVFSDETGGDYFDFPLHSDSGAVDEEGAITIAIGDVTGHGIGAALIMAAARTALRTCLTESGSLGALLERVNSALYGDVPNGRFMTMLMMRLTADGSHMDWASAGHDPPIIYSPGSDTFNEPFGGGVPLAILAGESYEQYELMLPDGDEINFTATDGVWETANANKELFGKDRLKDVLRASSALDSETIIKRVIEALDEFRGSSRPADDVTMVVVKRLR